jgi:hypothetical protein
VQGINEAREIPGAKNNHGPAVVFTDDQIAEMRRHRDYVLGKARDTEHHADLTRVIAMIESHMSFGPREIVIALRGLSRAAHGGIAIGLYRFTDNGTPLISLGNALSSPWGLYELGACE